MATSFGLDLIFNYASLAILATSGLVANLVVARLMGEAALGVFNQSFAIYIACSQLAVGGVHISVLRSVAQADSHSESQAPIVASGLVLAFGLGAVLCAFVLLSRNVWGLLLGSPEVVDSLSWIGPALLLFSLNKTLLAALNGQGRMRAFAVLQASRYIVLVAALTLLAWYGRPAAELSSALLYAEVAVLLGATPCLLARLTLGRGHVQKS